MSFSRFRSNVVYFQQFYASILFTNSSSAFSSILSTNSCLRISKIRFIIPMFLMFIYISRHEDFFSSVFDVLGDFLLFNIVLSIHIYLLFNFPDAIFRLSSFMQTLQLLLFPCHEPTTIQCSFVLSHCGFMFLFKLSRNIFRLGTEEVLQYIY